MDELSQILALAKAELKDVDAAVWDRFELLIRKNFGATRVYIAARRKRQHLEALAAADAQMDAERMAQILGISPRRVRQLKPLLK